MGKIVKFTKKTPISSIQSISAEQNFTWVWIQYYSNTSLCSIVR